MAGRRPTTAPERIPPAVLDAMRAALHTVADQTIEAVTAEVPGYRGALDPAARSTLAGAVELALRGFLALAAQEKGPSTPMAPALEAAYALGRGEARAGRTMDALLAAYRVGARVSWRGMAEVAVAAGLPAPALVGFAELVFAYIDQLSAASVAGHADELATEGRMRQRHLERLGHGLVSGADEEALVAAAQRAGWTPPVALVAVLLPEERVDHVLARVDPRTLQPVEDVPGLPEGVGVLLVPDPGPRFADALERGIGQARAVVGPVRAWVQAQQSYARALRAWHLEPWSDGPGPAIVRTEELLPELVVTADPDALADLRTRALAPLASVRSPQSDRLAETLRAWLAHRGRRESVAAELFVHPQTVRYRMNQVRALFGDALDDPRAVLELTIALAVPRSAEPVSPPSRTG